MMKKFCKKPLIAGMILVLLASCHSVEIENIISDELNAIGLVHDQVKSRSSNDELILSIHHKDNYFLEECVLYYAYKYCFLRNIEELSKDEMITNLRVIALFEDLEGIIELEFSIQDLKTEKEQLGRHMDYVYVELGVLFNSCNNKDMVGYNQLIQDIVTGYFPNEFEFEGCYPELIELYVTDDCKSTDLDELMGLIAYGSSKLEGFNSAVTLEMWEYCGEKSLDR